MFPEIPENLEALSAAELRALAAEIRKAGLAAASDPNVSEETLAEVEEFKTERDEILALAVKKERAAALADTFGDESEDEPGPPSDVIKTPDPNEDGTFPDADEDDEDGEGEEGEPPADPEETQASHQGKVRTATGSGAKRERVARPRLDQLVAVEGAGHGLHGGDRFESWTQLAECVLDKANSIDPGSPQKFQVGRIQGNFPENRRLSTDMLWNLQMFEEELTAAMCAPAQPVYDLGCDNTANRPVRDSLASFQPDARGAVTIYPSPTLSDIASGTGTGIWTSTNDANPSATKNPCATIACATPIDYRMYGDLPLPHDQEPAADDVPRTGRGVPQPGAPPPGLVIAEQTLLNAMGTAVTTITAPALGYGGLDSVCPGRSSSTCTPTKSSSAGTPRRWICGRTAGCWSDEGRHHVPAPHRRRDPARSPPTPRSTRIFTDAGVTPHWFLDVPGRGHAAATPLHRRDLTEFPRNAEMLVARRGKFALMDRGELNIGVTGNGMYRDNTSNSRNEFTFFFENFEGLVDTDSCPAHIISMPNVCWNGQQIADIFIDCEGDDVIGEDSGQA